MTYSTFLSTTYDCWDWFGLVSFYNNYSLHFICRLLFLLENWFILIAHYRKMLGEKWKKKKKNPPKSFMWISQSENEGKLKIQCFQMRLEFQRVTYLNLRKWWKWTCLFMLRFNSFTESFLLLYRWLWNGVSLSFNSVWDQL